MKKYVILLFLMLLASQTLKAQIVDVCEQDTVMLCSNSFRELQIGKFKWIKEKFYIKKVKDKGIFLTIKYVTVKKEEKTVIVTVKKEDGSFVDVDVDPYLNANDTIYYGDLDFHLGNNIKIAKKTLKDLSICMKNQNSVTDDLGNKWDFKIGHPLSIMRNETYEIRHNNSFCFIDDYVFNSLIRQFNKY